MPERTSRRRAGIVDVAALAGVSTATVSLVLRDRPGPSAATRASVHRAAEELGYRADRTASLLASRGSGLVGVVLDVTSPFHAELVVALDAAAAAAGLELVLATTTPRRSVDDAVETLVDSRCDALALLGVGTPARLEALAEQCRTVVVGRRGTAHVPGVRADDAAGLEAAVDHLVGLGHHRIAHAEGPKGAIASARRRGYLAAMRRHGLADTAEVLAAGQDEAAGLSLGQAFLGRPTAERPTAVVAFNDRCAIGIRDALVRAGLDVPGDLAIVGYDDSPPARLATVDLTSVSQDPPALAAATMAVLVGPPGAGDVVVPPRLVVRGSTSARIVAERPVP